MKSKIEIKELPQLIEWKTPKGLLENINLKVVTIYHDSFKITEPEKVRMSACISLVQKVEVNSEIRVTTIEKRKIYRWPF